MSDGGIRATQCPNATDPQAIYNQEKFLQEKNHIFFFVKQVMKTTVIFLNVRPFAGIYSKKNMNG